MMGNILNCNTSICACIQTEALVLMDRQSDRPKRDWETWPTSLVNPSNV